MKKSIGLLVAQWKSKILSAIDSMKKIYENCIVVEFGLREIPVTQQPEYPVVYKTVDVCPYIPDLICFEKIVVDTKTVEQISDHEIGKMLQTDSARLDRLQ